MIAAIAALCLRFESAEVKPDIPYVAKPTEEQKLDLYIPAKHPFKTVIFAYGGGWHSGSRKSMEPIGRRLQSLGYGCAMIGYRLSPAYKWPAQIEDAADAAVWVEKHIGEYGGDPKGVWLAGHSSGAQLVVLLATDASWLAKRGAKPADFRGVIGISTPIDLEPHGKGLFADGLMAGHGADVFGRDIPTMRDASPISHLKGITAPPILLLVGDSDLPGLSADAKRFAGAVPNATCVVVDGRNHMSMVTGLVNDGDAVMKRIAEFIGSR